VPGKWAPFPDIEAMIRSALADANVAGGRVYSSVPARPTYPLVQVQRLGGLPAVERRLDRARIQIDVWGNSKSEAFDIAETARLVAHEAEATAFGEWHGFITAVEDELGMTFLPDPETNRDRYVFAVAVYAASFVT